MHEAGRESHRRTPPVLTLLTDFGCGDYYVAAVKGTILSHLPGTPVRMVDISHEVAPGDVEGAAYLLVAAAASFPRGTVHLAVVDPGVGSERQILAAAVRGALFVAPDNGLLTRVLGAGEDARVHRVERRDLFLDAPGQTFHGRDRFAPVAAHLLRGGTLEVLGPEIDDPRVLPLPPPRREGNALHGRVAHIDRFGNLVTDIPSAWAPPGPLSARVAGHVTERRVEFYAQLPPGEAGILPGSLGTLELSLRGESLARHWGVSRGEDVVVCARMDVEPLQVGGAGGTILWEERVMVQWEYKIINIRSENYRLDPNAATQLDQLGAEGWELVSITSVNFKTGATDNIAMVFKRPVRD